MPKRKYSGSYRRNVRRKRASFRRRPKMNTKIMLRVARRAVLKAAETKFVVAQAQNVQLYHNVPLAVINNLTATTQGNLQTNRIGDEIYPVGIKFKLWLSGKADRPNVMYRVIFYKATTDTVGTNAVPSNFWQNISPNAMLEFLNTDKYTIVKDLTINPSANDYSLESGATNREKSRLKSFWFPLKGTLKYQTDNGAIPRLQKHCYSLIVCAYDAYGSVVTDNIASLAWAYKFYFKDP